MSVRKEKFFALASLDYDGKTITDLRKLFRKSLDSGIHGICSSPYSEGQRPGDILSESHKIIYLILSTSGQVSYSFCSQK